MNILHICDWYHPIGGAEKLLFDSLESLEERGHANMVVYNANPKNTGSGTGREEYACQGLEYFQYFTPGMKSIARQPIDFLSRLIQDRKPDVCHIHNFQNPYVTDFLVDTLPCARSVHDPRLYCFTNWKLLPDKSVCCSPLGRACIKNGCLSPGLLARTDFDRNAPYILRLHGIHKRMPVIIAESRAQIEVLVESGFNPGQIQWLPNFTPIRPRGQVEAINAEHFQEEPPVVLFVGRASYEKGAHVLLEACPYIESDCQVVLITAGPMLEELRERARDFSDKVRIIGGLSYAETGIWYARSSCVVVPSVWLENFCLVGLEAYALMKPVIGSRIGGIKDWLRHGETGYLAKPGDPRDLAAKIDLLLSDRARLRRFGQQAYERVCEYYNHNLYLDRLVAIYEKAITRYGDRS